MSGQAREITAKFPGVCLTCEEAYEVGDTINWVPGVGAWHGDCLPPRNLKAYAKEAAERPRTSL